MKRRHFPYVNRDLGVGATEERTAEHPERDSVIRAHTDKVIQPLAA